MPKIKSRNPIFKEEKIEKPKPALVIANTMGGACIYQCPTCGAHLTEDDCDVIGAEPDCLFCNQCSHEFRA